MTSTTQLTDTRDLCVERPILRIGPDGRRTTTDWLLREERFELYCNGNFATTFNCLPSDLEELAVGHIFCLGVFRHAAAVTSVGVALDERRIDVSLEKADLAHAAIRGGAAAPADCGEFAEYDPHVDGSGFANSAGSFPLCAPVMDAGPEIALTPAQIHAMQAEFETRCELFRKTGASHSCALAGEEGIVLFMEDAARHNCLDKIIGAMLLRGISPRGKAMIFSGRLAADMLEKVSAIGVKLLIAPGAPSLAAVDIAGDRDITLLGFVRKGNINVYTGEKRILFL
ncbi:formate dehydrogenase accessory sulfurtransferase FdhD [Desulfovibrio sp. OttesenSCG-928-I05]|nr:formate dehydrogenase accessory sulfurtransferase FdhD [Desulfovibrio sp. OttesenSCG-928-I05]